MPDMDRYEELEEAAKEMGIRVEEKPLKYNDGRIRGNRVLIRSTIPTRKQKAAVLCEEMGHHETGVGNILDQSDAWNRKQEQRGRAWSYDRLIGLSGIVRAVQAGCRNTYEAAELLDVPEDILRDALEHYRGRYGRSTTWGRYVIYFDPVDITAN